MVHFYFLIQELAELRHIYGISLLKAGSDERTIKLRLSEISTAMQRFSFISQVVSLCHFTMH